MNAPYKLQWSYRKRPLVGWLVVRRRTVRMYESYYYRHWQASGSVACVSLSLSLSVVSGGRGCWRLDGRQLATDEPTDEWWDFVVSQQSPRRPHDHAPWVKQRRQWVTQTLQRLETTHEQEVIMWKPAEAMTVTRHTPPSRTEEDTVPARRPVSHIQRPLVCRHDIIQLSRHRTVESFRALAAASR